VHGNLIVSNWSVLCRTLTIENNQLQLGIVTYNVLTGNKTTINVKFSVWEGPYFCVGYSVWITADHAYLLLFVVVQFDILRIGSCVVCGGVCYCNVLIIILMDWGCV
jgi:hypothetical protein